jgi:hypothetical protein
MDAGTHIRIWMVLFFIASAQLSHASEIFEPVATFGGGQRLVIHDARAIALNGAYTALAHGSCKAYWNPAALAERQTDLSFSYSNRELSWPEDDHSHAVSGQGLLGQIGLGAYYNWYSATNSGSPGSMPIPGGIEMKNQVALVGVGVPVSQLLEFRPLGYHLFAGMAAVYVKETFAEVTADGGDIDLGLLATRRWEFDGNRSSGISATSFRVGYTIRNLLEQKIESSGSYHRTLPRWDRAGMAWVLEFFENDPYGELLVITLSLEREGVFVRPGEHSDPGDHLGFEVTWADLISVRKGLELNDDFDDGGSWGFGFGLQPGNPLMENMGFSLDYAHTEPWYSEETHHFSGEFWIQLN